MRKQLIWFSIVGGVSFTALGLALRMAGIYRPVPYLLYPGSYLMQAGIAQFLEWLPWDIGGNLISETLAFFALNVAGYAFVIFILLRIFYPDRSQELPPIVDRK